MGSRRFSGGVFLLLSSAVLYLSFFLSVLAPVPLVWLRLHQGRRLALVGTLLSVALVHVLSGLPGSLAYLVFSASSAWILAELLVRRADQTVVRGADPSRTPFEILVFTALGLLLVLGAGVGAWAALAKVSPWAELERAVDWLGAEMLAQAPAGSLDEVQLAAQKREWIRNVPSTIAIAVLLQCWAALTAILRLNPARIRERLGLSALYSRQWKTPEWLVWPTLLLGFGALLPAPPLSDFCWNGLKAVLALYGLQGLAILSSIFDLWRLRGFIRSAAFFMVLMVMLPLVLALGFFDLWFDFRAKLRQS